MTAIKNHWITGLAILGSGLAVAAGIAMSVTGGEFNDAGVRIIGVVVGLGGLMIVSGLWGLRTGRLGMRSAHILIVVGFVIFGGAMWWFVLVPPAIALAVVWAGVVKQGLARELRLS